MNEASGWWNSLVSEYERINPGHIVEDLLGQGNSAAVFRLRQPDGLVALKIYKPEFLQGANEAAERYRLSLHDRLKGHDCESLVKVYSVGDIGESAYITMEFVPWPSMDTVLGAIPIAAIPKLMGDVARAVQWMEERALVHRDIKPANILVSPDFGAAKLVDFGVVRAMDGTSPDLTDHGHRRPFVATAQYSSPEYLFRLVEPSTELWSGLSIYQVGAVLHDMLEQRPLFNEEVLSENRYVLAMAVLKRTPSFRAGVYPIAWAALARRALAKDLDIRLRAASLVDFLKLDVFDAEAARRRLGLGKASQIGVVESNHMEAERKGLQRRKVIGELRDHFAHELRSEGYGRVRWIEQEVDSVWLLVQTPGSDHLYVSFRLQAVLLGGNLRLLAGCNLDGEEPGIVSCSQLLWEGALDQAESAFLDEIIPLWSEMLLKVVVRANDLATLNDDYELPMPILEVL